MRGSPAPVLQRLAPWLWMACASPALWLWCAALTDALGPNPAEALIRAGGHAEVVPAPNDSHMTIKRDFGVAGDPEGERAARFILG